MATTKKGTNVPLVFKVKAFIIALYALATPRTLTSGNGQPRHITHRLHLQKSKSFDEAIAACAEYETATGKPASFCLTRQDGTYAIDLDQNQIGMLTRNGFRIDELALAAPGGTFAANVEMRREGDEVLNVRAGEMVEIQSNHAVINTPSIALPQGVQQQLMISRNVAALMVAQMGSIGAGQVGAPKAPTSATSPVVGADFPEEDELAGAAPSAPATRDSRRASATAKNTRVAGK